MSKVSDADVELAARAFDPWPFESWQCSYDYKLDQSGDAAEARKFAEWSMGKRLAEIRSGARAALEAVSSIHETNPVWGDAGTVGNLIAQLRTFAPETPIHGAFHADAGDGRKAHIRGLTLSRERVDGRLIDTGNVLVPYSVVAWSAPDERPAPISKGETVKWPGLKFCEIAERNAAELAKFLKGEDDRVVANDAALAIRTLLDALSHTAGEIEAGEIEPVQKMHELADGPLTPMDRLRLHVYDHETFDFLPEDAEAILDGIEAAEKHTAELGAALRNIAEGNLGDDPWQANYRRIAEVARAALEAKP